MPKQNQRQAQNMPNYVTPQTPTNQLLTALTIIKDNPTITDHTFCLYVADDLYDSLWEDRLIAYTSQDSWVLKLTKKGLRHLP